MDKFFSLANREIIVDIESETISKEVNVWQDKPFLVGVIADGKQQGCYNWDNDTIEWLNNELPQVKRFINHNIKYDLMIMSNNGIDWQKIIDIPYWCTQVNAALINENLDSFSLDSVYYNYFNKLSHKHEFYEKMASIFGGLATAKVQMKNIKKAPRKLVIEYLKGDLSKTWEIYKYQQNEIEKQDLVNISNLENQVTPVLVSLERRGVPISYSAIESAEKEIKILIKSLQKDVNSIVGKEINVNSSKDLESAFHKLCLPIETSDKGNPSFKKDRLNQMEHPFGSMITELRSAIKMQDTFIEGYKEKYNNKTGCIHTNFNQMKGDEFGVSTGRLSSSDPNLQQVPNPKRGHAATAKIIRSLFRAPAGMDWYSGDWSQFEFRIFAHYTKDKSIIEAYQNNPDIDFHQATADLTGVPRNPHAKRINLGLVFGMGEGKLAWELGLPVTESIGRGGKKFLIAGDEAKELFNTYHSRFPGAKQVLKQAESLARTRGWVKTILGRKLHFPDKNYCYKAGGLIFQGSAADLMKRTLIRLEKITQEKYIQLVLPVHDEFNIIGDKNYDYFNLIKTAMEDIPELRVPIIANIGKGKSWWEASK